MSKLKCTRCGNVDDASEAMCSRCGTPYPVPEEPNAIRKGQVIANRYVVLDMIGRGGMGAIYKVQDNTLGEIVALKTLLPEYVQEKLVVERFFNEARIARGLSHPNIVRVHDIGVTDGMAYISMELLQGRTLRSMMDKVQPGRRIPLNAILRMFDALCAALDYAHQYTIHRDIKPENVMVLPDGTVKLMDFGISKLMSNPSMTSASMVMGTPHYMSPEQLKNSAKVDARADIYSVGVMLYEVLTGEIPTGIAPSPDTVQEVPRALDPIIALCCHRDPAKRYKNVAELREQLRKIRVQVETHSGTTEKPAAKLKVSSAGGSLNVQRGVAVFTMMALVAGAYFGLNAAEQRRLDIRANEPIFIVVTEASNISVGEEKPVVDTFPAMKRLVDRARNRAGLALQNMGSEPHYSHAERLLEEADVAWKIAEANDSDREGLRDGWPALHRYLAVADWPDGMIFVPKGSTRVHVAGRDTPLNAQAYFIDIREVSAFNFNTFCRENPWRTPPGMKPGKHPATYVTYYDAEAFLASGTKRKQLPTVAQWMLSAKEAASGSQTNVDNDEEGNQTGSPFSVSVNEWLRSDFDPEVASAQFGVEMPIITWNRDLIGQVESMQFEAFDKDVGFRGVIELPTTLEEAADWID